MTTMLEHLPFLHRTEGLIGLEIEVEGESLPNPGNMEYVDAFHRYWKITQDGSLRGEAWEYVFRKPISVELTEKALNELRKAYERCGSTVHDSVRAGIHVHVNVQDLTLVELVNFFTIYYTLEEVLTEYCGEYRAGNHFCLRACDAEYMLYALYNAFASGRFMELNHDNVRYSAMNITSLFKYGSIEFRALRSTSDFGRVLNWVKMLAQLKQVAKEFESPKAIIEAMSLNGVEAYTKRVLGDLYPLFAVQDMERKVYFGARAVQEFAFLIDFKALKGIRADLMPNLLENPLAYARYEQHRAGLERLEAPLPEGEGEVAPANKQGLGWLYNPARAPGLKKEPIKVQWDEVPNLPEDIFQNLRGEVGEE